MNFAEAVRAGLGELNAYRLRALLQAIGVTLGTASFITTIGMLQGGREEDRAFMEATGGATKLEVRQKTTGRMRMWARNAQPWGLTLKDLEAVRAAVEPLGAHVVGKRNAAGAWVSGRNGVEDYEIRVTGTTPEVLTLENRSVARGRFISEGDVANASQVVVLGSTAALRLFGADDPIGQTIRIARLGPVQVTTEPDPAGGRRTTITRDMTKPPLNPGRYTVIGVMEEKIYRRGAGQENWLSWMNRDAFIPLTSALRREVGGLELGEIQVKAPSLETVYPVRDAMAGALASVRRGADDYVIMDRLERLGEWQERRLAYEVAIGAAGAISLLVGGIVIMNILLASLTQRIREIGVRKALGAKDRDIFLQFLVESCLVAGGGGVLGVLLGVSLTGTVSDLMDRAVVVGPTAITIALLVSIGTGLLFGLYPGIRASRLDPIVALRYE